MLSSIFVKRRTWWVRRTKDIYKIEFKRSGEETLVKMVTSTDSRGGSFKFPSSNGTPYAS